MLVFIYRTPGRYILISDIEWLTRGRHVEKSSKLWVGCDIEEEAFAMNSLNFQPLVLAQGQHLLGTLWRGKHVIKHFSERSP